MFGILKVFGFGVAVGWAYQDELNALVGKAVELGMKGVDEVVRIVKNRKSDLKAA